MFGLFEKKKGEVFDHWYSLVPGFNTSTKEFYEAVEKELKAREVPGLNISTVDFAEGGILSSKREYLRMTRERLVFDICAAPFGTAFFFSSRFVEIPAAIQLWQLLVVLVAAMVIAGLILYFTGVVLGTFILGIGFAAAIYLLRNTVAMGLKNLDAILINSPVVGPIYENWFRKETYYRQDTRIMYRDTVNDVVKAKVEETTGAKGIKLIKFNDYSPILGELYKTTMVQLPQTPPAA
jgi:hypothetical protein